MSKIPKITQFSNALKNIFTPTRKSAAASQPGPEEARKVGSSETRPKNRLREFFSWFKALFKRKDKDIGSRPATANPNPTNIRQTTHSVLENAETAMPRGNKMLSKVRLLFDRTLFYEGLYVTKNYIQQFASNNISFTTSDGTKQTGDTLNLTRQRPESYSDHLKQFCGFDAVMAVNLSALLTKEGLNIVSSSITGQEDCQWSEKSFDVSTAKGEYMNDIKVGIKGMFVDSAGKRTKVENVTILLSPGIRPMTIENVAFLELQEPT